MRYARQGTIGYDPRDVADIVVSPIEDVDEKLVMLLNAFDSEVSSVELNIQGDHSGQLQPPVD